MVFFGMLCLTRAELRDKLLVRRRGGLCFETNGLFAEVCVLGCCIATERQKYVRSHLHECVASFGRDARVRYSLDAQRPSLSPLRSHSIRCIALVAVPVALAFDVCIQSLSKNRATRALTAVSCARGGLGQLLREIGFRVRLLPCRVWAGRERGRKGAPGLRGEASHMLLLVGPCLLDAPHRAR